MWKIATRGFTLEDKQIMKTPKSKTHEIQSAQE